MLQPQSKHEYGEFLKAALEGRKIMLMDGGLGTMIQGAGLNTVHAVPDLLNITHGSEICDIHRAYVIAGSDCITTNTFSTNSIKLQDTGFSVEEVFTAGANLARNAGAKILAGDIGPLGVLLEPLGSLSFEAAYEVFAECAIAAEKAECDLIIIETMADLLEAKAALLACLENTSLPVVATMTFGEDGRTFMGTTPAIAAITLSSMGACAVGVNCSLGPAEMISAVSEMSLHSRCPLVAQPNAGMPKLIEGQTRFDINPADFANATNSMLDLGVSIIGGCCGTTPEHISALRKLIDIRENEVQLPKRMQGFCVTSAQSKAFIPRDENLVLTIGERINPTGNKRLREALRSDNLDPIVAEASAQIKAGVNILDVNVGVAGLDEVMLLKKAVQLLQASVSIPLQLDSSNPDALEAAARIYSGRPLINSVNGKEESLQAVLPIAAKYGCCVLGLTLDENGIPPSAEGRFAIAKRIVERASLAGLSKDDIAIDCLVMSVATNQNEIREILRCITMVKEKLGVRTALGVSNVSFGMPERTLLNTTFLASAFGAGLDLPIIDPTNTSYSNTVDAFRVLNGQDEDSRDFVSKFTQQSDCTTNSQSTYKEKPSAQELEQELIDCIYAGRREPVANLTRQLLTEKDAITVINNIFIPALDEVGLRYEKGSFFLPQLMASAEAVKFGFDIVKQHENDCNRQCSTASDQENTNIIVLATVEGDIHDIGKNIVKMLLENYGFSVHDLGRDVSPVKVVEAVQETGASLVGLSALMTTTAPAMAKTISLLAQSVPDARVMVGGAVITPEFASEIGAHYYAKDAAASVSIAREFFSSI